MKELVEQIAKALVTLPDQVSVTVTESESERSALYELRVAPADLGRVIGKEGRTVNAIRTILNSVPYERGSQDLDFVPDHQVVISGSREVEQMEAERIRRGKFIG